MAVTLDPSNGINAAAEQIRLLRQQGEDSGRRRAAPQIEAEDNQPDRRVGERRRADRPEPDQTRASAIGNTGFDVATTARFMAAPELLAATQFVTHLIGQQQAANDAGPSPSQLSTADSAYRQTQARAVSFFAPGPRVDFSI